MVINNMALEQSAGRVKRFGAGLSGKLALALGLLGLVLGLLPRTATAATRADAWFDGIPQNRNFHPPLARLVAIDDSPASEPLMVGQKGPVKFLFASPPQAALGLQANFLCRSLR